MSQSGHFWDIGTDDQNLDGQKTGYLLVQLARSRGGQKSRWTEVRMARCLNDQKSVLVPYNICQKNGSRIVKIIHSALVTRQKSVLYSPSLTFYAFFAPPFFYSSVWFDKKFYSCCWLIIVPVLNQFFGIKNNLSNGNRPCRSPKCSTNATFEHFLKNDLTHIYKKNFHTW